jgi:hypothetical protein
LEEGEEEEEGVWVVGTLALQGRRRDRHLSSSMQGSLMAECTAQVVTGAVSGLAEEEKCVELIGKTFVAPR